MKEKALVIKTEQILDVEQSYISANMEITYHIEEKLVEELKSNTNNSKWYFNSNDVKTNNQEGIHYVLSDANSYHETELIIGIDNIREVRLTEIL